MKQIAHHLALIPLGFAVIVGALLLFVQPAHASTVPVTNTLDAGAGSLRQVVIDAADGDTVVFDSAVFSVPLTITLTSGQIEITKMLSIDGAASGGITPTISGNGFSRTFDISGTNNLPSVLLNGLIISNGKCDTPWCYGGAIANNGGNITISNGTFMNSTAYAGGAVWNTGVLTITNVLFSDNHAFSGGAVYNEGTMKIGKSVFISNTAEGDGGGISNHWHYVFLESGWLNATGGGLLTIDESTFASNYLGSCDFTSYVI